MDVVIKFPDQQTADRFIRWIKNNSDRWASMVDEDFYFMYSPQISERVNDTHLITFIESVDEDWT